MATSAGGTRVIAVTGASAGLGRAIVREFAHERCHIGLIARDADRLEAAKREVELAGGRTAVIPTDVARSDQVEAAAAIIERDLGPIDVWINNAMTSVFSPFWEMTPDEFHRVTEVTYLGVVYGTYTALRRMRERRRRGIVQVGSALAYRGIPLQSAYCGAKHAIQGFSESVRCELLHEHSPIRIAMVQMPALNTPQFGWVKSRLPRKAQPVPPIYQPEVGARAVVWAAAHACRELNVGLSTSLVVLGNKTRVREVDCSYDPAIFATFTRLKRRSLQTGRRDFVFTDQDGKPLSQEWLHKKMWLPTLRSLGLRTRAGQHSRPVH
jgi:short-subunit dehydrogenase